jgi:hypothetical protein
VAKTGNQWLFWRFSDAHLGSPPAPPAFTSRQSRARAQAWCASGSVHGPGSRAGNGIARLRSCPFHLVSAMTVSSCGSLIDPGQIGLYRFTLFRMPANGPITILRGSPSSSSSSITALSLLWCQPDGRRHSPGSQTPSKEMVSLFRNCVVRWCQN